MDTTWFDFETDYPDIAGPVSRILKQRDNAHRDRMAKIQEKLFAETLELGYPDWQETANSPEFREWLMADPDRIKSAEAPGVKNALRLLHDYDADHGRGKRLGHAGDFGMADVTDRVGETPRPRGPDPFAGFASLSDVSLSDIMPAARGKAH